MRRRGIRENGRFTLTSQGAAAEEVVQLYLSDLEASVPVPLHKLVNFERVHLQPGENQTISFTITPEMMQFMDDNGRCQLEPGAFRLTVGGCSPGARGLALGAPQSVSIVFTLT